MTELLVEKRNWLVASVAALIVPTVLAVVAEDITRPRWFPERGDDALEEPQPADPPQVPDSGFAVPYAPAPGRDDRTPIAYMSHVFALTDRNLPSKLSGIGPVFWKHGGQGTGALIKPDLVLTTGHLFAKEGMWYGPFGLSEKPPAPSDGEIYLSACGRSYTLKSIHLGSMAPRARLGLDYALAELVESACPEATVLPVVETPEVFARDFEGTDIFLNMGSYRIDDLERYAFHPVFNGYPHAHAVFGVRCIATGREDTGDVDRGSTGVITTEGCDGIPGGSGGPALFSRDGGASYTIVGVANSYIPDTEYNNYTRVEGAFARHLREFVDVGNAPASATNQPTVDPQHKLPRPWLPTNTGLEELLP